MAQTLGQGKEQRFRGRLLLLQEGESILIVFPKVGGGERGEKTHGPLLFLSAALISHCLGSPHVQADDEQ